MRGEKERKEGGMSGSVQSKCKRVTLSTCSVVDRRHISV